MLWKLIGNGTWSGAYSDAHLVLCFLIVFTLIVEVGGVWLFIRLSNKEYPNIENLLLLIIGLNLITGFVGFLLSLVAW